MRRTIKRAQKPERVRSTTSAGPPDSVAAQVGAWWDAVLTGRLELPHPMHGSGVRVHLKGGRMRLAGEVQSREERDELLHQATKWIGHGIDGVDAKGLTVVDRKETAGILDQILIAAFRSREVAELARTFVLERSRVVPKRHEIIDRDHAGRLSKVVPEDFIRDAVRELEAGRAILVLQVDETEIFNVREVLEEETQSIWTTAAPPRVSEDSP
jgi:hypothetical protein